MNRPFVDIKLTRLVTGPVCHSDDQSLDVYGTTAFGMQRMRAGMELNPPERRIEAWRWWSAVPVPYQSTVFVVVERVTLNFIHQGALLTEPTLEAYVRELNDAIWREVEPLDSETPRS